MSLCQNLYYTIDFLCPAGSGQTQWKNGWGKFQTLHHFPKPFFFFFIILVIAVILWYIKLEIQTYRQHIWICSAGLSEHETFINHGRNKTNHFGLSDTGGPGGDPGRSRGRSYCTSACVCPDWLLTTLHVQHKENNLLKTLRSRFQPPYCAQSGIKVREYGDDPAGSAALHPSSHWRQCSTPPFNMNVHITHTIFSSNLHIRVLKLHFALRS